MNHNQSIRRIALSCALIIAATATTAYCKYGDDRYGLQYHYKPWGKWGPEFTAPNPSGWANFLQGKGPVNQRTAQRQTPSRTTRFDDLNLLVNMPSGPWTKQDPKKTGSRACFLIRRRNPTIVISLAGERVGTEAGATNNSLLAESQAKMKQLPSGEIEPGGERQLTANGIEGLTYEATADQGDATTHYSIWVAAHNGYTYKLAVYGNQKDRAEIDSTMRKFVSGMKQIQPTRVARAVSKAKSR
jgi:hypothetical protein